MLLTTTSQLPPRVQATYDRVLMERAIAENVHGRFGQAKSIKKRSGTQMIFRRYNGLSPATTPLTEGVTPAGKQMSKTDVTATLLFYGDYVTLSDVVDMTVEDDVLIEAKEILGEQAGETIDILTRDVLVAGTNVLYPGTVASRVTIVDSILTADMLKRAQRALKRVNAKPSRSIISATDGVGTAPVWKGWPAVTHPDVITYLQGATLKAAGYTPLANYSSSMKAEEGEEGAFEGLRFFSSTNAKVFEDAGGNGTDATVICGPAGNTNVYTILVFGDNAYGTVKLGDRGIEAIVQAFGSGGTADPLKQRATAGWKGEHTTVILNELWMVRLEFALPVLAS